MVNKLPCKEWGCISNPGILALALILRVPDETELLRSDINKRLLNAIGGNSVGGWSDLSWKKKIPFLAHTSSVTLSRLLHFSESGSSPVKHTSYGRREDRARRGGAAREAGAVLSREQKLHKTQISPQHGATAQMCPSP